MKTTKTQTQYLIGTCLGCKKCLYCGADLNTRKKTCSCNKTIKPTRTNRTDKVKVAYPRVSSPDSLTEPLKYIQEKVTQFGYSLDLKTTFNFTFCSTCNSSFQRIRVKAKSTPTTEKTLEVNSNKNNLENNNTDIDDFVEINEAEQVISFNLLIKPATGAALPSKWVEIEVSSLDDILADIHYYIGKLIGDKEIAHSDYLVTFKSEKAAGAGARLVDTQDYKKFLLDYKKLSDTKKNMTVVVSMKKKEKQKRKVNFNLILSVSIQKNNTLFFLEQLRF
jgi:hypothetical protein